MAEAAFHFATARLRATRPPAERRSSRIAEHQNAAQNRGPALQDRFAFFQDDFRQAERIKAVASTSDFSLSRRSTA